MKNFYLGLTPKLNVTDPILAKRDIDLLQFGVVLYEMATGTETDINNPDMHPPACPSIITSVLEKVFGSEPISIPDLLQMPLFTKATVRNYDETELIAQLGPRVSNFINNTVASSKSKKKVKTTGDTASSSSSEIIGSPANVSSSNLSSSIPPAPPPPN